MTHASHPALHCVQVNQFDNVYPMSGEDIGCMRGDALPNNNNNTDGSSLALSFVLVVVWWVYEIYNDNVTVHFMCPP